MFENIPLLCTDSQNQVRNRVFLLPDIETTEKNDNMLSENWLNVRLIMPKKQQLKIVKNFQ